MINPTMISRRNREHLFGRCCGGWNGRSGIGWVQRRSTAPG